MRLFLLFFPFQIRTLLYAEPFYFTGNFNIYRSFFVYCSDLILLITLVSFGIHLILNKKSIQYGYKKLSLLWLLFIISLFISLFFAENKILSFLLWLRWLEGLGLYFLIIHRVLSFQEIIRWLSGGIALQAIIAVGQFLKQSSLGLRFLGEPMIGKMVEGVAKLEFGPIKIIRPYGTFSHPNILAGSLLLAISLASVMIKKTLFRQKKFISIALITLLSLAFLLTFSRSALVAALITSILYLFFTHRKAFWGVIAGIVSLTLLVTASIFLWKENPLSTLLFASHGEAFQERFTYLGISLKMFLAHPFGVGLGDFTFAMQNYTAEKLSPWLFQPVHNIFLLILNEGGMLTGLLLIILIMLHFKALIKILKHFKPFSGKESNDIKKKAALFLALFTGCMIIGLFDHYFISLPEGQTLFFLLSGLIGLFLDDVSKKMTVAF